MPIFKKKNTHGCNAMDISVASDTKGHGFEFNQWQLK